MTLPCKIAWVLPGKLWWMCNFVGKYVVKELTCNHVSICELMLQINKCEVICHNVHMSCNG